MKNYLPISMRDYVRAKVCNVKLSGLLQCNKQFEWGHLTQCTAGTRTLPSTHTSRAFIKCLLKFNNNLNTFFPGVNSVDTDHSSYQVGITFKNLKLPNPRRGFKWWFHISYTFVFERQTTTYVRLKRYFCQLTLHSEVSHSLLRDPSKQKPIKCGHVSKID